MEQLISEVQNYLSQGVSPEEIMQALVQQGVSEQEAQQVIQTAMQAMQGGGQGGQPQEGGEGGSVLEAALQEDPELVYAIIMEFSQLAPEQQQALMQEIEGMLQGGQGQPQEQAPQQPQGSGMFQ
jgi:DNA-binding transcriptional MerR regulator